MNDQTLQLIRDLAEKFGTTSEHLWAVLVRQAPISGALDLFTFAVMFAVVWFVFRFLQRNTTDTDDHDACWDEEYAVVAWVFFAIFSFAIFLAIMFNFTAGVSAIINPEFWALKQIIG